MHWSQFLPFLRWHWPIFVHCYPGHLCPWTLR